MEEQESERDQWEPGLYDEQHSFVWKLASSVVELLDPQPGERILDVGCGTGQLTAQIAESGAEVVGLDNSAAMIAEARRVHPQIQFRHDDAHAFEVDEPFDAVFSNAALHWIQEPSSVVACIAHALKPQGRMSAEFGGAGNVRRLASAIEAACRATSGETILHPWYFPSIGEFSTLLERNGLEVTQAALIDRPTPLEGEDGLRNWVRMFGAHWLSQIPPNQHDDVFQRVEEIARPTLYRDSIWHADYRRIRIVARKTASP